MSEVKRFFTALGFDPEPYVDMIEDTDGTYVYYEDYETLRAQLSEVQGELMRRDGEVAELKMLLPYGYINVLSQQTKEINRLVSQLSEAQGEIADLKNELNRCDCGACDWCNGTTYYHMKRKLYQKDKDCQKAEAENAELKTEIERRNSKTWCAYCGFEIDIDDEASTKISEHIMSCPKHPIRIYERHSEALEAENTELQRKLNVAVRLEADSDATFDWNVLGKIDDLERENDELRERLKPVEKVCKKWDKKGDRELLHRPRLLAQELWQAIKAACEEK